MLREFVGFSWSDESGVSYSVRSANAAEWDAWWKATIYEEYCRLSIDTLSRFMTALRDLNQHNAVAGYLLLVSDVRL